MCISLSLLQIQAHTEEWFSLFSVSKNLLPLTWKHPSRSGTKLCMVDDSCLFRCPLIHKPYLFCLHASPVTCVRLYENCNSQIYESLHDVTVTSPPAHEHASSKEWPAMGGFVRSSEPTLFDILVTGLVSLTVTYFSATSKDSVEMN
jgi:hypothetical protein